MMIRGKNIKNIEGLMKYKGARAIRSKIELSLNVSKKSIVVDMVSYSKPPIVVGIDNYFTTT